MKITSGLLSAFLFVSLSSAAFAAPKTSKLYGFKGKYTGSVNYGGVAGGSTTGSIRASKTKDVGTITLTSLLSLGGTTGVLTETISIQKRTASYVLQIAGTAGIGSGSVSVSKSTITYTVPFSAAGQSYSVTGTITKTKKGLNILETISGNTNFAISYALRRSGK